MSRTAAIDSATVGQSSPATSSRLAERYPLIHSRDIVVRSNEQGVLYCSCDQLRRILLHGEYAALIAHLAGTPSTPEGYHPNDVEKFLEALPNIV